MDVDWDVWQREYARLLHSRRVQGADARATEERRGQPRFALRSGYVTVQVQPCFRVSDLSISGIAFLSEMPFPPGSELALVLEKTFAIPATVMSCDLVESDPLLMEVRYHVGCRFHDEQEGMQFLVMATELDCVEITQGPF